MKTTFSLSDLLFPNQTQRKVLAWLLMHPGQSIHLRELARQTQAAPRTLKKDLDALCMVGLLHSQWVGNQLQFQANVKHPVFPELQALVRKASRWLPGGERKKSSVAAAASWVNLRSATS